jgi:broad specificity phosphatase PhoE
VEQVVLVRHAESEFSAMGLVNGVPATGVALSPVGVEEARRLGELLVGEEFDLCVTTEFPRTVQTADLVLDGRTTPRIVVGELNDPRYGDFEGGPLEPYRAWAASQPSSGEPPGEGESRVAIVRRYVGGYRALLARPERTAIAVLHSLPIAYVLAAHEGLDPAPRVPLVAYATAYRFSAEQLAAAVDRLAAWAEAPTW